jgi:hypothetical protein
MMASAVSLAATTPGMSRWVHTLGFRGHFSSKSRSYSTTLGAIRQERVDYQRLHDGLDDDTTLLVGDWSFVGVGYGLKATGSSP